MFDDEITAKLKQIFISSLKQSKPPKPEPPREACCYGKIIDSVNLQADLDNGVFCDFCREYFAYDIQFCIDEGY